MGNNFLQVVDELSDLPGSDPAVVVPGVRKLRVRACGGSDIMTMAEASSLAWDDRWFEVLLREGPFLLDVVEGGSEAPVVGPPSVRR